MANAMQEARQAWERWLSSEAVDADTRQKLQAMDDTEVLDSFYRDLAFGTGGLRGELGPGTNRMNLFTVGQATQGLANYLNQTLLPKCVAIAYDSRMGSAEFARRAASVLAANGIVAWIYPRLEPTPALSFAVRDLRCGAGICVTASHNPAKYNGYKVYGEDGCQITLEMAEAIGAEIAPIDPLYGVSAMDFDQGLASGMIRYIGEDTLDRFVAAVKAQAMPVEAETPLRVVYTPLNGTGLECVQRILKEIGVTDVHVVEEQRLPDGHFPTCPYPNPEIREALTLGLRDCAQYRPDLLLATDPDCDRVGIAVPEGDGYVLMTGNEVGVLLLDFICRVRQEAGTLPQHPVAVSTIVSTAMADGIAAHYGVELRRTLTGFKFIGEQIGLLEKAGEVERYIFGFEESYGYLSGSHVRDKDAVNASMLICQMARWYKHRGCTLYQAMQARYKKYGYYLNTLYSFAFEGAAGMEQMQGIMTRLRQTPPTELGAMAVERVEDYIQGVAGLPAADVLAFCLQGGCKVMIRPSGTEPKLKAYLFSRGDDAEQAAQTERRLHEGIAALLQA